MSGSMPPIKVPSNLPELVKTAFARARANGDLNYYTTQVAVLTPTPIPFQLRYAPALANKPEKPEVKPGATKPFNPFENPTTLLVTPLEPAYNLVLNRFAVVPEHAILATKEFKPQTHILEADDLAATYACIESYYANGGQQLYAFFNSGEHSGASQPHRHIQLLPVARMRDGLETCAFGDRWTVMADRLVGEDAAVLPFKTFAERLTPGMDAATLHGIYIRLYRRACSESGEAIGPENYGEAKISYNLAMTRSTIVIMPRQASGSQIKIGGEAEASRYLGMNGSVLAGTVLVKRQDEWDALRKDPWQLLEVLAKIGMTSPLPPGVNEHPIKPLPRRRDEVKD